MSAEHERQDPGGGFGGGPGWPLSSRPDFRDPASLGSPAASCWACSLGGRTTSRRRWTAAALPIAPPVHLLCGTRTSPSARRGDGAGGAGASRPTGCPQPLASFGPGCQSPGGRGVAGDLRCQAVWRAFRAGHWLSPASTAPNAGRACPSIARHRWRKRSRAITTRQSSAGKRTVSRLPHRNWRQLRPASRLPDFRRQQWKPRNRVPSLVSLRPTPR